MRTLKHEDYTVGWISVLHEEMAAARAMFDEPHTSLKKPSEDTNTYTLGRIGGHNVVLACLPAGRTGLTPASSVATHMRRTFRSLRFCLLVGIGGGIPSNDNPIRLGDVVVSKPSGGRGGVVQYDFGKVKDGELECCGHLDAPPHYVGTAVNTLRTFHDENPFAQYFDKTPQSKGAEYAYPGATQDLLFQPDFPHVNGGELCSPCDKNKLVSRDIRRPMPYIYYGNIGSGNKVIQDPVLRDSLGGKWNLLCFEMEAAGITDLPCLVIRGISDYSDSHKNELWRNYASMTAAVYAKQLLGIIQEEDVITTAPIPPTPSLAWMVPKDAIPMKSVSLGRVVATLHKPWHDFCPESVIEIADEDMIVTTQPRMHQIYQECRGSSFYTKFTALLMSLCGIPLDRLDTTPQKTYFLSNPAKFLKQLCGKQSVQSWFEVTLKYAFNTYMVVAIHTMQISPNALPNINTIRDPNNEGWQIVAVQYSKVMFTWFNWYWGHNFSQAYLDERSHWTVTNSNRDDGADGEDVEAEIQSSLTVEDVEDQGDVYQNGDLLIVLES